MIDHLFGRAASRHAWAVLFLALLTLATAWPGQTTLFPMDRDEPRFAQASKQMLESGDFVDIRLQDEARNKKPVGIYWLQVAAVTIAGHLGVVDARDKIWVYRLPSLAGAIAAVLLTYWAALPLLSRRGAVLAGALLAGTMMLVIEAHLAKTDAVLLATVVAAMAVLGRAWMARAAGRPLGWPAAALFWTAVGVGILVKGPITPMVPLFAAAALSVRERSGRWLMALRPAAGLVWCLLLVLPWFVLIVKATGTGFFADSVGQDMVGKVATAQESHGAPFGTYLAAVWLTGWPLAPMLILAAPHFWRERRADRTLFLLAWSVPTWLLFELVPTKLPHYVLPTYPALAILAAAALDQIREGVRGIRLILFAAALALPPALLPVALALSKGRAASTIGASTIALAALACVVALAACAVSVSSLRRGRMERGVAAALLAAFCVYAFVFGWFLSPGQADLLALSPRLADAARTGLGPGCPSPAYVTVGDREPSLVFLTATTILRADAIGAARFMAEGPCRAAFVADLYETSFAAALPPNTPVRLAARVAGVNLNGGHHLDFGVYVRGGASP